MDIKRLVELMQKKPYLLKMGKGLLARRYNTTESIVVRAKELSREKKVVKLPRVLILDIETAPMRAFVWKRWKENISLDQTISEWFMLCWSAKWLYSTEVYGEVSTPEDVLKEDDSVIVGKLWELVNQADIVVTHNGDKFDLPRINSRFIVNGLPPTKPYFSVDTCKVSQKQFGFSSNKLNALAGYFGFDYKLETSFELWKQCLDGDAKALAYMLKYNKRDVTLLEEVYLKLRPWIKAHPNLNNFCDQELPVCSICGSEKLEEVEGEYYYTTTGKYKLYRCKDCGALTRGRKSISNNVKLVSVGR